MHIDDTFTATTSTDEFENVMRSQFNNAAKRDVDLYLEIHIDYLPNGDIKIVQPKLLQGLLEEYKEELINHRARAPTAS